MPPVEPLTVDEVVALARLAPGNVETDLIPGYISAAREQVERDTGVTLLDATTVPPLLKWACGLLACHYLLTGRDLAIVGTIVQSVPMGYEDAIRVYRQESLA